MIVFHQTQKCRPRLPPLSPFTLPSQTAPTGLLPSDFTFCWPSPRKHGDIWPRILPPAFAFVFGVEERRRILFHRGWKVPSGSTVSHNHSLKKKKSLPTNSLPHRCICRQNVRVRACVCTITWPVRRRLGTTFGKSGISGLAQTFFFFKQSYIY